MKSLSCISCPLYSITKDGSVVNMKTGKVLKPFLINGYLTVHLRTEFNTYKRNLKIHKLVALVYLGECPDDLCVNHKDGNKLNNSVNNLEYVSIAENNRHAQENGLRPQTYSGRCGVKILNKDSHKFDPRDKNKPFSQVVLEDFCEICSMLQEGYRVWDVSAKTGYSRRVIQKIVDNNYTGKFKDLISNYDFSKVPRKLEVTDEMVVSILTRYINGESARQIHLDTGISRRVVEKICSGKTYKEIYRKVQRPSEVSE